MTLGEEFYVAAQIQGKENGTYCCCLGRQTEEIGIKQADVLLEEVAPNNICLFHIPLALHR